MRELVSFPHEVKPIEHIWIPLRDGGRLAARIWLPADAEARPVPALMEYIPYRKRDMTRRRDSVTHPYLAGHGYACVRVDLRGSGESSGVLRDEYLDQELFDGVEAIEWISRQPWCTGKVGMFGISWGGFNSLQVAALCPKPLGAIITACSTDDLYRDNMHYMGGCLLSDNLSEATVMLAFNSLAPDPLVAGEDWRRLWRERLEGSGLWIHQWLQHQRRDEYWYHGSVCEDYSAIRCPVMAVSGWTDGYTNAVFRLLENLEVPRKGLIGPWSHKYPHMGVPGPAIGFLQESLRWWDYWLKGEETGIMREPMVRAWMQDSVPPTTSYRYRPGRWVEEPSWPSPNVGEERFMLDGARLVRPGEKADLRPLRIQSPLTVGLFAGKWCSYAATPDLPHDQREEDGGALVFESEPLGGRVELLGSPKLRLRFSVNRPVAMVAARLSDVAPDGKATRVTYGLLNLNHLRGHDRPEALDPDRVYDAELELNYLAQVIPRGNRVRVSLSSSYWPLAWPSPEPICLTVFPAGTELVLPVRRSGGSEAPPRDFEAPEGAVPTPVTRLQGGEHNWRMIRDLARDESVLEVVNDDGRFRLEEIDLEIARSTNEWYSSVADDFSSPRGETRTFRELRRAGLCTRVTTRTVMTCNESSFFVRAEVDAFEGDKRVFSRNWDETVARDHI